ncbi:hypothetical protein RB598_006197 [Gaeumannomyces tritici]
MIDRTYSPVFWVPTSLLLTIAFVVSAVRFRAALRSARGWSWDDTTAAVAFVMIIALYFLEIVLYSRAFGRRTPPGNDATIDTPFDSPIMKATGLLWMWALNITRVSIGLLLLPLRQQWSWWRWTLWTVIALNIAWLPALTAVQLTICIPIWSQWIPTPGAVCMTPAALLAWARTYHVFNFTCNLVLSLLPLTFVYAIHRRVDKLAITFLMTAGLAASAIEIVYLVWFLEAYIKGEIYKPLTTVIYDLLGALQLLIGYIAACLPKTKPETMWLLRRLRLLPAAAAALIAHEAAGRGPDSLVQHLPHGAQFLQRLESHDLQASQCTESTAVEVTATVIELGKVPSDVTHHSP